MKYNIITTDIYSVENCKTNQRYLYIFGDNMERIGTGGQAIIRYCTNTVGIAVKKSCNEYMSDSEYSQNQAIINEDIKKIHTKMKFPGYTTIVFPTSGIEWGRADMQEKCPKTALYLAKRLMEEFGYNNLQDPINKKVF